MKIKYIYPFILFVFVTAPLSAQITHSNSDYSGAGAYITEGYPAFDSLRLFVKLKEGDFPDLTYEKKKGFRTPGIGRWYKKWMQSMAVESCQRAFQHLQSGGLESIYVFSFGNFQEASEALKALTDHELTEYAEFVPVYYPLLSPNDYTPQQSAYLNHINLDLAWDINSGDSNVRIAVVDDAVRISHEDLSGNCWLNDLEIPGNGIDDDSNTFVDDFRGYDVADGDSNVNPPPWASNSLFTHGTHVCGIAAAATDNGTGIAGVGFRCRYIPVKTKKDNDYGPGLAYAYLGLEYAIVIHADVINMSWGGFIYSQTYQLLCNLAHDTGIVLVASAGNTGTTDSIFPAAYDHVIAVGSTNPNDVASTFSTYGSFIDVMAPGVSIYSSLAGSDQSYGTLSGTSMAAPITSGICALMLANNPQMTPDEVEQCLKSACTNINEQNPNKIGMLGSGRVDAFGALTCVEAPPRPCVCISHSGCLLVCPGSAIQINGTSLGLNADNWYWQFPGGNPSTSTDPSPNVQYNIPGTFDIIVVACNQFGCDTLILEDAVCVQLPSAALSSSLSGIVCQNNPNYLTVSFSGHPPFSFAWSDGTQSDTIYGITDHVYWFPVIPANYHCYMLSWMRDFYCEGNTHGQVCLNPVNCGPCANTDFEFGNFSTWMGKLGMCCGMGNWHNGISPTRMMLTTGSETDPYSGGNIPVVSPFGGNTSLRLGNYFVGAEAEILEKKMLITHDNASLTYEFAVVLEDPLAHSHEKKPKFEISFMDMNGNLLPDSCAYYQVTAGPETDPWEHNGTVRWQTWQQVTLDLTPYMGQEITMQFKTEDCGLFGHFGYAYLDARCAPNAITIENFCYGTDTITLSAPAGYISYLWDPYGDSTQSIIIPAPSEGDTISVLMRNIAGCINTASLIIHYLPVPVLMAGGDTAICLQDTAVLWAIGAGQGGNYHWYSDPPSFEAWTDTIHVMPTQTTTYYVEAENSNGCSSVNSPSVTVHVDSTALFDLGPDVMICLGDTVMFCAPSLSDSLIWYTWPTTWQYEDDSILVSPEQTLTYVLHTLGACDFRDSIRVEIYDYLYDNPITHVPFCSGTSSVTLSAPPWAIDPYWPETGDSSYSVTISPPQDYGIFSVWMMTPPACPDTLRFILDPIPDPDADAGPDTVVCSGFAVQLQASGTGWNNGTYSWTSIPPGFTSNSPVIVVSPSVTTDYVVIVTNGPNCPSPPSRDTVRVTVMPSPSFEAGPDLQLCKGDSVQILLNSQGGFFFWESDPPGFMSQDSSVVLKPDETTTYHITLNTSTCTYSDFFTIEVFEQIMSNDTATFYYCAGDSTITLEASPGYDNYYWLVLGASVPSLEYTQFPLEDTSFMVLMQDTGSVCKDSCMVLVRQVIPTYFPDLHASDTLVCEGDSVNLSLQPGGSVSFSWYSDPPGTTDTVNSSITVFPNDSIWYYCTTTELGCGLTDSVLVVAWPVPEAILPDSVVLCPGGVHYQVVPDAGGLITWSDASGPIPGHDSVMAFSPVNDTFIVITISNSFCSSSDTMNLFVHHGLNIEDTLIFYFCTGDQQVQISGPSGYDIYWWPGDTLHLPVTEYACGLGDSTFTLLLSAFQSLCPDTAVVSIRERTLLPPELSGDYTSLCSGETLTLTALADTQAMLLWYALPGGLTDSNIYSLHVQPQQSMDYVCVSILGNCIETDTFHVDVYDIPVFVLPEQSSICPGTNAVLDPGITALEFFWSDMDTIVPRIVGEAGIFILTAKNGHCIWSDTAMVSVIDESSFRIPNVFTPNGDGHNDVMEIMIENSEGFILRIFDRWGDLVFETTDPRTGWNGRIGGDDASAGVYYYTCRYYSPCQNKINETSGTVQILR